MPETQVQGPAAVVALYPIKYQVPVFDTAGPDVDRALKRFILQGIFVGFKNH